MATLNIKNLPDGLYRKLRARAAHERRSIAQEVTVILSAAVATPARASLLDLQGLGKAAWAGSEAVRHVAEERRAWD